MVRIDVDWCRDQARQAGDELDKVNKRIANLEDTRLRVREVIRVMEELAELGERLDELRSLKLPLDLCCKGELP